MSDERRCVSVSSSELPAHAAHFYRRRKCPYLLEGGLYSEGGVYRFSYDSSRCVGLCELMDGGERGLLRSYRTLLRALCLVAEASIALENWLIEDELISLAADDIFFETGLRRARLLIKPSGQSFSLGFASLLTEISGRWPSSNADIIKGRLDGMLPERGSGKRSILRELCAMELELRG